MADITKYPETEVKMYRVTFDMKERGKDKHHFVTVLMFAVSEEAAKNAVYGCAFSISEATNAKYIIPRQPNISVFEIDKARLFTENANGDD